VSSVISSTKMNGSRCAIKSVGFGKDITFPTLHAIW
jgi:hypothetical protein